jgi:hypothetical protein
LRQAGDADIAKPVRTRQLIGRAARRRSRVPVRRPHDLAPGLSSAE